MPFRFDQFVLDPQSLRLTANGAVCTLEPKSFRLLQFLIENRQRVVPKEEILSAVWEGTAVSDNALTRAVAQIRKALDDDPKQPRYIETVPTVGYRFMGQVRDAEPVVIAEAARPARPRAVIWAGTAALMLVGVGLAAWTMRPKAAEPSLSAPVTVPLTTYRGSEVGPTFSPDGNQVAFSWDGEKQDNFDIYVKVLGSDTPLRLTTDPAVETYPAWSPDGRTIAFMRITGLDRLELVLIPSLGGPERKLAEIQTGENRNGYAPEWSADSKWLVVPSAFPGTNRSRLLKISLESGEASQITDPGSLNMDSWPKIPPDGKTLLFTRKRPHDFGDLYEARIDANVNLTEPAHQIPLGGVPVGRSAWTEDGREILAMSPAGLFRSPAAGTDAPQRLAWFPTGLSWMTISRKGHRLAYATDRGDGNIWRIDLRAREARPERLIASTFRDVYPSYSPDGKRIAFYSNRSGGAQMWVSNAEGGQARQLTFVERGTASTPSWRPDGKMLVLDSNVTGTYEVYTMSPEGGKLKQLTQGPATNFAGTSSRDGRWIYFASNRTGRSEVWKMPAEGGAPAQVTKNGGVKALESADGKTIYFSKETGAGSIWKMPAGGGAEEKLVESLYRFNFAVGKQGIYYMTAVGEDGKAELRFVGFGGGEPKTIAGMGYPEFGLDVSPDGRYLIYAQMDDIASDLMLVENFR